MPEYHNALLVRVLLQSDCHCYYRCHRQHRQRLSFTLLPSSCHNSQRQSLGPMDLLFEDDADEAPESAPSRRRRSKAKGQSPQCRRRRHKPKATMVTKAKVGRAPPPNRLTPECLALLQDRRGVKRKANFDVPSYVSLGSDCAGYSSEGIALELLHVPHKHAFASEKDAKKRHLLYAAHGKRSMKYFADVTTRDHSLCPEVDLYVFGAPCQPWSPAGNNAGLHDRGGRGVVFFHCLNYVNVRRPRAVLVEQSDRFGSARYHMFV